MCVTSPDPILNGLQSLLGGRQHLSKAMAYAGLSACGINEVATAFHLPVGGYGTVGVCVDSAAIIQQVMMGRSYADKQ